MIGSSRNSGAKDFARVGIQLQLAEDKANAIRKLLLGIAGRKGAKTSGPLADALRLAELCEQIARDGKQASAAQAIEHVQVLEILSLNLEKRLHLLAHGQQSSAE